MASEAGAKRMKEFRKLLRTVDSFSNGQVEVLLDSIDFDSPLEEFSIRVRPNSGPYRGGQFEFSIGANHTIEHSNCPQVECKTRIYHPNIDYEDGNICFSLLDADDYVELEDLVHGLVYLLYNPVIDDPLSSLFNGCETWEEYVANVRTTLRGGEVGEEDFERNLVDGFVDDEDEAAHDDGYRPRIIGRQDSCSDSEEDSDAGDEPEEQSSAAAATSSGGRATEGCRCDVQLVPTRFGQLGTSVDECATCSSSSSSSASHGHSPPKWLPRQVRDFFTRLVGR